MSEYPTFITLTKTAIYLYVQFGHLSVNFGREHKMKIIKKANNSERKSLNSQNYQNLNFDANSRINFLGSDCRCWHSIL